MGIGDVDAATGRGTFAGSDMFREISAKSSIFAKNTPRNFTFSREICCALKIRILVSINH